MTARGRLGADQLPQISTPAGNPPAGAVMLYAKSDGYIYRKTSAGAETLVGGGVIAEKPVTDGPTTYPVGYSIFETSNAAWPSNLGTTLGTVITDYSSANRGLQVFQHKNNVTFTRTADAAGTNGWSAWVQQEQYLTPGTFTQYLRGDKTWQTAPNINLVRVISQSNITLTGTQTIDSVALNVGDRVLLTGQTSSANNGVYTVATGTWTRSVPFETSAGLAAAIIQVAEGSGFGGTIWKNSFRASSTLGSSTMTWYQVQDSATANANYTRLNTLSAKGDLYVATAASTPARLPAGTDGQILAVDSTTAQGVKWTTSTANGEPAITPGATGQYWRGDKTWATVGLGQLADAWVKPPVRAATTTNITLSDVQTIDGVSCTAGDRVLVKNQTTAAQNGIYVVVGGAAWTRASDASVAALAAAATVTVLSGTVHGGQIWTTPFKATDTLDATAMTWTRVADQSLLDTKADLAVIAARNGTDNPSTYPTGRTVFDAGSATGWPDTNGTVTTDLVSVNRGVQTLSTQVGTTYVRMADTAGTNGWSTWFVRHGPWQTFTPTFVSGTLGNGTLLGYYQQVGKTVNYRIELILGSTSVLTSATARFGSLPIAADVITSTGAPSPAGSAMLFDTSANVRKLWTATLYTTASIMILGPNGETASAAWTWAVGDQATMSGTYQGV